MSLNSCHFIGIGGIGMSGLAKILLENKKVVTGSDLAESDMTRFLVSKGAKVFIGHSEEYLDQAATVIFSSDISNENPEYLKAKERNQHILHRSDLLALLMNEKKTLAVTGTHGKTTTSALLAWTLKEAGFNPSIAVGGLLKDLKTNALGGTGDYFVAEADESDGTFLKYHPFGAILTNIDFDHMNHFKTKECLIDSFKTFFSNVASKEKLFFCGDDEELFKIHLEKNNQGISYGFLPNNELKIRDYTQKGWSSFFNIDFRGNVYREIEIATLGEHNVKNGAAVFGLALAIGVEEASIRKAFKSFGGVARRCEKRGFVNGVLLLDDYGHHPTEIKTTLKGIRTLIQEKRLIVVFQPHRYSRTKEILGTFKTIFDEADLLILTDIYGAGEKETFGLTHQPILDELEELNLPVRYIKREDISTELKKELLPQDVVVSFGAGDITRLPDEIIAHLVLNPIRKMRVGLVFGGRSTEHEISILSARNVANLLNKEFYEPQFFAISKKGDWFFGEEYLSLNRIEKESKERLSPEVLAKMEACDLFFPILHGPFGEDGTIQGFFETIGKPYVGSSCLASAVAMDKAITKSLMLINDISTSPFVSFTKWQWEKESETIQAILKEKLTFPLFVKPAHLGSSIGISRVENLSELQIAIEMAFKLDGKVLVENEVKGREIEFALLGNENVETFFPGEILTEGKIYSYDLKYLSGEIKVKNKADLSEALEREGMLLAKKAYSIIGCKGLARVDFFLDNQGKYWLNEINPIPGFTNISLYPKVVEAAGISQTELIDRLIILALEKQRKMLI